MNDLTLADESTRPLGYVALCHRYQIDPVTLWHESFVSRSGVHSKLDHDDKITEIFPLQYDPGDRDCDQLAFALKYDGVNLALLTQLFARMPVSELVAYIQETPLGKFRRQIWYFYEFLTGNRLPIDDLPPRGGYVDLLDPEVYYTISPTTPIRRQRINENLLGDRRFCPIIRKSDTLKKHNDTDFRKKMDEIVAQYPKDLLTRAMSYSFTKETKSSFELEKITPSVPKTERFVALLLDAERVDYCVKSQLIELQNRIVDNRYRQTDYRSDQNYIGEIIDSGRERVHYVCPKPAHIHELMAGLLTSHLRLEKGGVPPIVHAAIVAFGFVYLHPFDDGNGRIHRFLIHNVLARRGITPPGMIFPISAVLVNNKHDYDHALEVLSKPIMSVVDYKLDEDGCMSVENDISYFYRYMDLTVQTEYLHRFIQIAIECEVVQELAFLVNYDVVKERIQDVVDMPERKLNLFIRICRENRGRLSKAKRNDHFDELSDEDVAKLEAIIREGFTVEEM